MVWSMSESDEGKHEIEIRIHSRGGQGGVTAAKMLAVAASLEGKYSTAFSIYGAERRGSPTASFTRISNREIRKYSQIRKPDCVIVMDPTIASVVDVTEGLKPGGKLLINVGNNSMDLERFRDYEVYAVDATRVSLRFDLKVAGIPVLNVPMVGAAAKLGIISLDSAKQAILKVLGGGSVVISLARYAGTTALDGTESLPSTMRKNLMAAELAYKETKRLNGSG